MRLFHTLRVHWAQKKQRHIHVSYCIQSQADCRVIFSGFLPRPRISIVPASVVALGQTASIVCSTSAEFAGGTYALTDPSGSFRKTQTSSTNSSAFTFPNVDFDNGGLYQCQHRMDILGETLFSKQSDVARLTVTGKTIYYIFLSSSLKGRKWRKRSVQRKHM